MNELIRKHCCNGAEGGAAAAKWLTIYIEEAHAKDQWHFEESKVTKELEELGDEITTHTTITERCDVASKFVQRKGLMQDVVCDGMQGQVLDRYQAWPERLYVIVDGVVVYKGGIGPFHFDLNHLDAWLDERLGTIPAVATIDTA